jgi:tetratricopeptide (TPR) repeat protein
MKLHQNTISSDLVGKLQSYSDSDIAPDDFAIARFKKDISALMTKDPQVGYMVSGIFYSLLGDFDKSDRDHKKSLNYGANAIVYSNYVVSLSKARQYKSAYAISMEALKKLPGNISLVSSAIMTSYSLGKISEVINLFEEYKKLAVNEDICEHISFVVSEAESLKSSGVDLDELSIAFDLFLDILDHKSVAIEELDIAPYDGEYSIFVRVGASPEVVSKLNDDICDVLIELDENPLKNLSMVFLPSAA